MAEKKKANGNSNGISGVDHIWTFVGELVNNIRCATAQGAKKSTQKIAH